MVEEFLLMALFAVLESHWIISEVMDYFCIHKEEDWYFVYFKEKHESK